MLLVLGSMQQKKMEICKKDCLPAGRLVHGGRS